MTPSGGTDLVLLQMDAKGKITKQRHFVDGVAPQALAVDPFGNVAIVGSLTGKADFTFTRLTSTAGTSKDQAFISRFLK